MFTKKSIFLITFCYIVITTMAWRPFQVRVTNISSISYVDFIQLNSSISTKGAFSLYVNALQDISSLHVKVLIMLGSAGENYDLQLLNRTVDACEFLKNRKHEPILQVFYKSVTNGEGVYPKTCPMPKKLYYVKDVLVDANDFPPVLPSKIGYADLTAMTKNGNKLIPMYRVIVHAESSQLDTTKK